MSTNADDTGNMAQPATIASVPHRNACAHASGSACVSLGCDNGEEVTRISNSTTHDGRIFLPQCTLDTETRATRTETPLHKFHAAVDCDGAPPWTRRAPSFPTASSPHQWACLSGTCGEWVFTCRINVEAYSNAELRSPARWHSITVDVRMGTTCVGKHEMLRATLINILAAPSWSPRLTIFLTCRYNVSCVAGVHKQEESDSA